MSFYLPEVEALFLHVPRTGGTWVTQALHLCGIPAEKWNSVCPSYRPRKHTILPHYRPEFLAKVKFVFAFVRYPIDYYVSVWRFTTRCIINKPEEMSERLLKAMDPAAISEAELRWKPDFDEWLDEMLKNEPGWATRWFERFVGPPRGEFCHFVGRTETLEEDLEEVLTALGYVEKWNEGRARVKAMHHARNQVLVTKVPLVKLTDEQKADVERSERVAIARFYDAETTLRKRWYRDASSGVPVQ